MRSKFAAATLAGLLYAQAVLGIAAVATVLMKDSLDQPVDGRPVIVAEMR